MLTYVNMNMNMTKLWCKIMPNNDVEQIEGNEGSYFYLYPFVHLVQGSFQGGSYVCIKLGSFSGSFLTRN